MCTLGWAGCRGTQGEAWFPLPHGARGLMHVHGSVTAHKCLHACRRQVLPQHLPFVLQQPDRQVGASVPRRAGDDSHGDPGFDPQHHRKKWLISAEETEALR